MHTVGLIGHTGNVGAPTLKHLLKPFNAGLIKIVVLHREGSNLSAVPEGVETRVVDISKPVDSEAVKGIHTLVTAVAFTVIADLVNLVDAFAKSPDAVTLIPCYYAAKWSAADLAIPQMGALHPLLVAPVEKAKALGLGVTIVHSGLFSEYLFTIPFGTEPFVGTNVNSNTVQANSAMLKNTFPVVTHEYLGAGIAQIVTRSPSEIKGQTFSLVEYRVTGADLISALETVNGAKPTVVDFTDADYVKGLDNPIGPVGTLYKAHWSKGEWEYPGEFTPDGVTSKSLVDLVRTYKE